MTLFLTHGAIFVSLKTDGELRTRANALSVKMGLVAAVLAVAFLLWSQLSDSSRSGIGLTVHTASSTPYTLKVMTIVAIVFTPIVLAYQAWSYWVFHRRLSANLIPNPERGVLEEGHAN